MDKAAFKLTGSILGVAFDVTTKAVLGDNGEKQLKIAGDAWGMPVDVTLSFDEDAEVFSAAGTLLGNEFTINSAEAAEVSDHG